jgi:ferritin
MISPTMEKALNEQINKELYSSYYYYAMAAFLENEGFEGMANFMKAQALEDTFQILRQLFEHGSCFPFIPSFPVVQDTPSQHPG